MVIDVRYPTQQENCVICGEKLVVRDNTAYESAVIYLGCCCSKECARWYRLISNISLQIQQLKQQPTGLPGVGGAIDLSKIAKMSGG